MTYWLRIWIWRDFEYSLGRRTVVLFSLVSIYSSLLILYLTSQAIGSALQTIPAWKGQDYFSFLLTGELLIGVPQALCQQVLQTVRQGFVEGMVDRWILAPRGIRGALIRPVFASLPRVFFHFFVLGVLAKLQFGYVVPGSWANSMIIFGLVLPLSFPLWFCIGLISAYPIWLFGRGFGVAEQILYYGVVLAGVYFPLNVLPQPLLEVLGLVSPFTVWVEFGRHRLNESLSVIDKPLIILIVMSCASWFAANLLTRWGELSLRRNGIPVLHQ